MNTFKANISECDIKSFVITYENGDTTTTGMNATLEEATVYYVGNSFNFGDTEQHPADKMLKAVSVAQIINGYTVTRKSIFYSFEIFNTNGTWANTYRDMIDVEKFCNHPGKDFIRLGEL